MQGTLIVFNRPHFVYLGFSGGSGGEGNWEEGLGSAIDRREV